MNWFNHFKCPNWSGPFNAVSHIVLRTLWKQQAWWYNVVVMLWNLWSFFCPNCLSPLLFSLSTNMPDFCCPVRPNWSWLKVLSPALLPGTLVSPLSETCDATRLAQRRSAKVQGCLRTEELILSKSCPSPDAEFCGIKLMLPVHFPSSRANFSSMDVFRLSPKTDTRFLSSMFS